MSFVSLGTLIAVMVAITACTHPEFATAKAAAPSESVRAESPARVPGEYVVTLGSGENVRIISERYGHYGIKSVNPLGGEVFLLNLMNDPGLQEMEALSRVDSRIKAVQPNFIYRANQSGKNAD